MISLLAEVKQEIRDNGVRLSKLESIIHATTGELHTSYIPPVLPLASDDDILDLETKLAESQQRQGLVSVLVISPALKWCGLSRLFVCRSTSWHALGVVRCLLQLISS